MDLEERRELIQRLFVGFAAEPFEKKGIPARRLGSVAAAAKLLKQFERLQSLGPEKLQDEYAKAGLPQEVGLEREVLLDRLKEGLLWGELPLAELRKECSARNVSTSELKGSDAEQRRAAADRLLLSVHASTFETMDIPARRLGSVKAATKVAEKFKGLEAMSMLDLGKKLAKFNVPSDGLDRLEATKRLKTVLIWTELPLSELQIECRSVRAPFKKSDSREEMVQRLVQTQWGQEAPHQESKPRQYWQSQRQEWQNAPPLNKPSVCPAKTAEHFQTLQLPPTASISEVKKAYHQLALKLHPDKNPKVSQDFATQEFRRVSEAYEGLCAYLGG